LWACDLIAGDWYRTPEACLLIVGPTPRAPHEGAGPRDVRRAEGSGAIGSAVVSETAGCRFESCLPCSYGRVVPAGCARPTRRSYSPDVNSSQNAPSTPVSGDGQGSGSSNPFLAIGLFVRQVIAELRKIVIPTRRELILYSMTVLAFVIVMILFIFGLDTAFSWLSRVTFSNPDAGL